MCIFNCSNKIVTDTTIDSILIVRMDVREQLTEKSLQLPSTNRHSQKFRPCRQAAASSLGSQL
jgi:hypothetical protein